MAVYKTTQKKSDSVEKFKATEKRSYDSALVYDWQRKNKESYDTLEKYRQRINSGGYLSSDDIADYRKALDSYVGTSSNLRGIAKAFGQGKVDDDKQWTDTISQMKSGYQGIADYYSQWDSEDAYNAWHQRESFINSYLEDPQKATATKNYQNDWLKEAELRDETRQILGSQDFGANSQYVSTKADNLWDKMWSSYGLGYNDLAYEYINNQNGIRDEIKQKSRSYSADNAAADGETKFEERGYDYMTADEIGVYNYYYRTEGKERSQEYLDAIEDSLVMRKAGKEFSAMEGDTLREYLYGIYAGTEQFATGIENIGSFITGGQGFTPSSQYVSGLIREDLADDGFKILGSSIGQIGYDMVNTTANMLPSILIGTVTGGAGGALSMGASATGNAYEQMMNLGYDKNQARNYSVLVGASEAGLQYLLGGISKLGGKLSDNVVSKLVSKVDNAIAKVAIDLGGNMLSEGVEEAVQSVLEPLFKAAVTGEDFEGINLDEVLYSGLLGALSAGLLEGAGNIVGNTITNVEGKQKYGGFQNELVGEALEIDPGNSFAQKMQGRLDRGKDLSGSQLNRIVQQNEAAITAQDMATIQTAAENRLAELGETGDVATVAAALTKQAAGKKLSKAEQQSITDSKYGSQVARELDPEHIKSGESSSEWAERIGTQRINAEEYSRLVEDAQLPQETAETAGDQVAADAAKTAQTQQTGAVDSAGEWRQDTTAAVSEDGLTRQISTGKTVTPQKIVSIEGGKAMIQTDSGTVAAEDIAFGDKDTDLLWRSAVGFNGITPAGANGVIRAYRSGDSVTTYLTGAAQEFRNGYYNMDSGGEYADKLTPTQREIIYELGQNAAGDNTAKAQAQAAKSKNVAVSKKERVGKVHFDRNGRSFDAVRETALKTMEQLSAALGVEFYVFESYKNAAGELVYKDANGNEVKAPNGYYDPKDGSVHIDLNAGADGKGTMLFTIAHELTHFIKQWSPAKFKVLANFLTKQYSEKGVSIDELVDTQIANAARNGRELSWEEAYEEMVADSMEAMLADGNVIQMMAELKQQDKTLWQKICDWFKDLVTDLKALVAAYDGYAPDSQEGRMVADMQDVIVMLESFYADALVDASDNYQAAAGAQKNTTRKGGVRFMAREDSVRIKEQIVAVSDQLNKMDVVASVTTDGFGGMQKSDIAKAVEKEYAKFGKRVDRQNFGIILLEFPQINKALEYLYTDGEKAALLTVPRVIKRGIIADMHTEHKERGVDSITFAAPVEINGKRGNVGVVVQRVAGTNRFKTLRILLPNGKAFEFVKNTEADSTAGSSSKHNGLEGMPIESASKNSIRNAGEKVKNESVTAAAEKNTNEDGVKYSQRYLAADPNSKILDMVNRVVNGDFKANEKVYLGTVTDETANRINELTGIHANGFEVAIEARQVEHILKDHGANGDTDHSMADPVDIAKMEYVLGNPDDIRKAGKTQAYTYMRDGRNRTADTVLYEKNIGEKSYYVVQAVPDTKAKTLYIVTAFIGESGYKKEAPQLINAKGPDATAKTGSVNASTDSIRNSGEKVKNESVTAAAEKNTNEVKYQARRLTEADIQAVQSIGRISVNQFSAADIKATERFAQRYWQEMGIKSPFFRAWFGDWRANDQTKVQIATQKGDARGVQKNQDTGWDIQVSGKVFHETKSHNMSFNQAAVPFLPYINDIVKKAVLLDSSGIDNGRTKSNNSLLMHSLFAVADIGSGREVLKLYVEEMNDPNTERTSKRAYQLQNIEKYQPTGKSSQKTASSRSPVTTGNINTVADLFAAVKQKDTSFNPKPASKVVGPDGTPMVMYHGSPAQFTIFDRKKAKSSGQYGRGFYFTNSQTHAGTYGQQYNVYLNIRNPLQQGAEKVSRAQVRSFLDAVAENEDYAIENYGSYDIDNALRKVMGSAPSIDAFQAIQDINATAIGDMVEAAELFNKVNGTKFDGIVAATETVAFYPEQIKSATDNIGTFDGSDPDIRYSVRNRVDSKTTEALEKENEALKKDVSKLKELLKLQKQVTGGKLVRDSSVEAAARVLKKQINANGDTAALAKLLKDFYTYIAQGNDLTWENVKEQALPAARWLTEHRKRERSDYAKDILSQLHGSRIYLDEIQKEEAAYRFGSYNEFRKGLMGSITIANEANVSLDSFWQEMSSLYPDVFDQDTNAGDMPSKLADIIEQLRNSDTSALEYAYSRDLVEQDMIRQIYDSYWNVSTLYTVADVKQREINRLKGEHIQRMNQLRSQNREQVETLKQQHRDAIAKVRQEYREQSEKKQKEITARYQESRKKSMENRQKAQMRQKIRRTIMDLDKLLNKGDKKRNVKEGMQDLVTQALKAADILFTDTYTNEDMVRNGVGTELTEQEEKYMAEAKEIMAEIGNLPSGSYEAFQERQETEARLKRTLDYRMSKLQAAFVRERGRLNKTKVSEVLGALADAYLSLENSEYNYVSGAFHENVHQYLLMLKDDVGGTTVKDMSLGQLEELHKAYTMVLTTVRNANKMFAANLKETREQLGNQTIHEVKQFGGEHGLWMPGADKVNKFSWNNEKPIYAFERIGSATLTTLFENTRAGEDVWAQDMTQAREYCTAQKRKYKYDTWDFTKQYKFISSSGIDFTLSLEQIMSLYAYSKREQAYDHLLKGGFVFDGNTEVQINRRGIKIPYLNRTAKAHNVSVEILGEIVSKLNPEQKAFVDDMQDYLSTTMGAKGNEVSMQLYGVELFKEKHYFPLRSAGQYMERAKEADLKKEQGQISIANSGFTKATTPKSSNPVVLSGFMDVWAEHVNEMSMYHGFVLPMEDFRRVYNYSSPNTEDGHSISVNSVIQDAYGKEATDYIDQLYRDLNGGAISDPRESMIKGLTAKFKKAAVFASLSVVIQQPSAIGRAFAIVDPKYFIGSKVDSKQHKALWTELKRYAPVAIIKEMGYFDTGMGKSAQDFIKSKEYHTIKEKAAALFTDENYRDELLSKGPALADELTWCAIWEAVKRETKAKNPGLGVTTEEFLIAAGKRFTEVITKTQVYDSVLARSANMRSKGAMMGMWTAFMAESTTTINMIEDALRKGKRGNKKYAARVLGACLSSITLNSMLVSLVRAMRDDDEDETFLEKYTQSFATEILDGMNPLTYYPFLKDIWSALQGFDIERADMSLITSLTEALTKLVQVYSKDTDNMNGEQLDAHSKSLANAWWNLVDYITALAGIPVKNVRRDINGAVNLFKTVGADLDSRDTTWGSLIDKTFDDVKDSIPVIGWLPSETTADKLYEAAVSGDTAYHKRLASSYATEASLRTAIRKGLRNNDPRIRKAARAKVDGNADVYRRLLHQIQSEGKFALDDILGAISSEESAIRKAAKPAS